MTYPKGFIRQGKWEKTRKRGTPVVCFRRLIPFPFCPTSSTGLFFKNEPVHEISGSNAPFSHPTAPTLAPILKIPFWKKEFWSRGAEIRSGKMVFWSAELAAALEISILEGKTPFVETEKEVLGPGH